MFRTSEFWIYKGHLFSETDAYIQHEYQAWNHFCVQSLEKKKDPTVESTIINNWFMLKRAFIDRYDARGKFGEHERSVSYDRWRTR